MHFGDHNCDTFIVRDIRRYPNDIDRVSSRRTALRETSGGEHSFTEIAAGIEGLSAANIVKPEQTLGNISKPFYLWEKESVGFGDFVDIINPLHHIPVVATIYRNLSGDQIGAVPRVIGGALWGRLGGFVAGIVNAVVEWWSGKDIGDHIYAAIFDTKSGGSYVTGLTQKPSSSAGDHVSDGESQAASVPTAGDQTVVVRRFEEGEGTGIERMTADPSPLGPRAYSSFGLLPSAVTRFYEQNLDWDEAVEPHRIRFPA